MGFPQIGYQAFKLLGHQRLHEMAAHWEERYPGVDIVLIEPEPTDELMFRTSIMNFTSRIAIARHGFQSVASNLANGYERYREVSERHGIEISGERLRTVVEHFEAAEPELTRDRDDAGETLRRERGDGAARHAVVLHHGRVDLVVVLGENLLHFLLGVVRLPPVGVGFARRP